MATFWDKRARQYDNKVSEHGTLYDKTIEASRSLLQNSDVVLDFACASGEMSLDLAAHVERIHGIDQSGKMIEIALGKSRDRDGKNASFDQMEAFDPSLEEGSFSAILAFSIFHLLEDPPKALTRLSDLLATGGTAKATVDLVRKFVNLAQKSGLDPAIRSFTVDELEALFSDSNFEILNSKVWDEKSALQWIAARKSQQTNGLTPTVM